MANKAVEEPNVHPNGVSEHAGFPNAATDSTLTSLNISKLLVKNPAGTFFMRVEGSSGDTLGVFAGDIVVIDRTLGARPHDIVIWWGGEEFTFSRARQVPKDKTVWGVMTFIIHKVDTRV